MLKTLGNAVLFQLGWFACVLGGNSPWLLLAGGALLVHLLFISRSMAEVRLVVVVCLLGSAVDSLLLNAGIFAFKQPGLLIPFWLILLWALLAITLKHGGDDTLGTIVVSVISHAIAVAMTKQKASLGCGFFRTALYEPDAAAYRRSRASPPSSPPPPPNFTCRTKGCTPPCRHNEARERDQADKARGSTAERAESAAAEAANLRGPRQARPDDAERRARRTGGADGKPDSRSSNSTGDRTGDKPGENTGSEPGRKTGIETGSRSGRSSPSTQLGLESSAYASASQNAKPTRLVVSNPDPDRMDTDPPVAPEGAATDDDAPFHDAVSEPNVGLTPPGC